MAKLYFRYGTVGSAKTMNLLAVAHNYQQQGKKVILMKPKFDVRFGASNIKSRSGLEKEADFLVTDETALDFNDFEGVSCILIDEAQFLGTEFIDQLRRLSLQKNVPIICYGLRTDFRTNLFTGSQRLLEVADAVEEVKTTCYFCNHKAIYNMKFLNGKPTTQGPAIDLGAEEKYLPSCANCYAEKLA